MITRLAIVILIMFSCSYSYCQFSYSYQGTNLCPVSSISNTTTSITINTTGTKPAAGTYYVTLQYYHPTTYAYTSHQRKSVTITSTATSFTMSLSFSIQSALISADVPLLIDIDQQASGTPYEYYLYYPSGTSNPSYCAIVLPLTFVSFNISSSGSYNKLQWVTASESNTSFFKIQRSTDAVNFVDHGIEPAANHSSSNLTYSFYTPKANSGTTYYYRICCVDLDGTLTYSTVQYVTGSGSGNPTDFCSYTTIEGPTAFCTGVTSAEYKLHNAPWTSSAAWSVSPSNASIAYGSYGLKTIATLTKTGTGSTTTLSITAGGCTKTKTISLVQPSVSIQTSYSVDYPTHTTYYVYASPSPAGSGTNFRWYKNGSYYGTFSSDTIAVTSSEGSSNWSVVASTACGDVTGSTTLYYHSFFGMRYVLSPVPANNLLTISPNLNYTSSNSKESMIDNKCLIQIVDMFGNLKKEIKNVSIGKSYQIDVSALTSGNYIIHVINGNDRFSSQVRIEK